jgi:signal transduction histidine kinase
MKRSLQSKLILSYLAVALLTVLVVSALIWLTSGQSLRNLVMGQQTAMLKQTVQDYYTSNGTLDGFFGYYMEFNRKDAPPPQSDGGHEKLPPSREMRGVYGLVDTDYRAILPTLGYGVGETVPKDLIKQTIAVEVDGQTIARILPDTSFQFKLSAEEQLYLHRSMLAIGLAALAGVLAAVAMGFFLAGRLLKPIGLLTRASQSLARGNLEQQVPVTSQDELGLLTTTFNQMSADLVQADQQRKRMTADITHDLSTPLLIISGYVEMLEEGDVTLTPQRLEIIKTEIEHLRRLVGDLTTLSQVEAGGLDILSQPVQPSELLERVYHAYQLIAARQGVELTLDVPESVPEIQADEGRMVQVLKNLLENALRYTSKGGIIQLSASADTPTGKVELRVTDNGAGIEAEDLAFVFDRFYRADKSRGANSGKMGLGLAICKALVTAQGGTIFAESAGKDKGTAMVILFPLA